MLLLLVLGAYVGYLHLGPAVSGGLSRSYALRGLERDVEALREFGRLRQALDTDGMALLHAAYLQRARTSDGLAVQLLDLNDQLRAVQGRLAEAALVVAVAQEALRPPAPEPAAASAPPAGGSEPLETTR